MCDTRGGTSANFLHTAAHRNKFGALPKWKRDCANNSLDKLPTGGRNMLSSTGLSEVAGAVRDMWMDVNKRA